MDSVNSFPSMFELLWYSGTPCFDVAELTSDKIHEKSVIKQCLWKGEEINCSQVFTLTPTDKGMCCRFDLKKPKNIFTENMFTRTCSRKQWKIFKIRIKQMHLTKDMEQTLLFKVTSNQRLGDSKASPLF